MKIAYLSLWWLWPLIFFLLIGVQETYGTNAFGDIGILFSLITLIGSLLTGIVGIILLHEKQLSKLMLISVAIAISPFFVSIISAFKNF